MPYGISNQEIITLLFSIVIINVLPAVIIYPILLLLF